MQAPAWLPYRWRDAWDNRRIASALRGLERTQPTRVLPAENAAAEVQMLLCRRDVRLAVLSLKSLLRHEALPLALAVTDDGSLSESDHQFVNDHFPGVRWLPRVSQEPAVLAVLAQRPHLRSLYEGRFAFARRLVHPFALAGCERVVQMDADTLFYRFPQLLADWIAGKTSRQLFLHDQRDESVDVPADVRAMIQEMIDHIRRDGQTWRMPYYFFNAGLLAFCPRDLDLDLAERFLAWRANVDSQLKQGKPGIWFGDWTQEQTSFLVMFGLVDPPSQPLGNDYRIGFNPDAVFCHFLRHGLIQPATLKSLSEVVRTLL